LREHHRRPSLSGRETCAMGARWKLAGTRLSSRRYRNFTFPGEATWGGPARIRRFTNRPGLRRPHVLRGPTVAFLHAEPLPQPSAGAGRCRARFLLHDGFRTKRRDGSAVSGDRSSGLTDLDEGTSAQAASAEAAEADPWRAGGEDRASGRRRAVPLGRDVTQRRVRLLGPRLLGVRKGGCRGSTQLVRAGRHRPAHREAAPEAWRRARLLGLRARGPLCRARPNGACASLGCLGRGRAARPFGLRQPARHSPPHHSRLRAARPRSSLTR
jgi:hypothetical protein